MKREHGFTLVEMVAVITLTLILTAASIAGLRGVRSWRSAAAVRRVQSDVLCARNEALLSSRRTLCVFDLGAQSYELQQEATPGTGNLNAVTMASPLDGEDWEVTLAELSADVRVTSLPKLKQSEFGFGPDGLPIDAKGARISSDVDVLFNSGATLRVYAGSGIPEVRWP